MKNSTSTMLAEMFEAPRPRLSTCVLNVPYRGPSQTLKSLQIQPSMHSRRMLDYSGPLRQDNNASSLRG